MGSLRLPIRSSRNLSRATLHKEDVMLVAAGFEPEEVGDSWSRDGVSYGREASLQFAWREWRKH